VDIKKICNQIRYKIKEKGFTQDEFAKLIGVSIPTLNRWLRAEGLLFQDLNLMLEKLDVKLSELALLAEGDLSNKFTYTIEQESLFVNTDGLLAFFDQLLNGKTVSHIAKSFKLTEKSLSFYLSKLDKLKLIEWLPNNKVKILVTGEPSWIVGGPLSNKFRRQIIDEHIHYYLNSREQLRIGIYSLSSDSYKKINDKYQDLIDSVRLMEIKDSNNSTTKKITTVILGHGQSEIPLLTKIPNR
jgi:transcriptional regulator with XRE-family HTH domain